LIFVVEIKDVDDVKIFYASLLPLDIKELLDSEKGKRQKSLSIPIKPLGVSNTVTLENICYNFLLDREKQFSTAKYSKGMGDLLKYEHMHVNAIIGKMPPEDYILNNDLYLYGKEYENSIPIPISKIKVETISHQVKKEIVVNSKKFYNEYTVLRNFLGAVIEFGKCIKYNMDNSKLEYKFIGNLEERIRETGFLLALIENGSFKIGEVTLHSNDKKLSNEQNEQWKFLNRYLKHLKDIETLLGLFKVDTELDMNKLTEKQEENLYILIENILYNKRVKDRSIKSGTHRIDIANLSLLVFINVDDDGYLSIEDFFNVNNYSLIIAGNETEKTIECSPYINLTAKDLSNTSNIKTEVIESSIKQFPLDKTYSKYVTFLILELIKAFDSNRKLDKILRLALDLSDWLISYDDKSVINTINRYQIIVRERPLIKLEIEDLIEFRNKHTENDEIACAISILLKNKTDYEFFYSKLPEEKKSVFVEYPISNLTSCFDDVSICNE
jgi:hypothetical protein